MALLTTGANAAFGVITKGNGFSVDTNAGLTFDVNKYVFSLAAWD